MGVWEGTVGENDTSRESGLREWPERANNQMNSTSVFELSPAEKLQLVEDLWDDIAAEPEEVPVQDWQKRELARRKANLMSNPASLQSWDEVRRRIRENNAR